MWLSGSAWSSSSPARGRAAPFPLSGRGGSGDTAASPATSSGERSVTLSVLLILRRAAGPEGQLDSLTTIRLPRVAFLGDLHVDPHRLLVKLLELGELGGGVLTESRRDGYVASADDDFHHDPPSSSIARNLGDPRPIGLCPIEPGGTRPADLVFDPTFAC